jgi:hypothetical protein
LSAGGIPKANQIIGAILNQVEIEGDNFADHPAESIEIGGFPLSKMFALFVGKILFLVFGGIVNAVPELLGEEWSELAPP